ncbi:MAG: ATP-binding cassette domain-containing protein [Bacilli bacterium]|nr:ATP-binding cassette domain-containing protein [Bacilli bacterium]
MQVNDFIKRNRIIGVVGNSGSGKSTFVKYFKQERKVGVINLDIIKVSNVEEQIEYYVKKYNYRIGDLESRKDEIIKMLEIDEDILYKDIYEISESELSKVLMASVLLYNPETIILDEMLDSFDSKTREKILKLFIKLKKFFNKTILIVTSNIDDIYEFIDDVIVIDEGKVILYGDKYEVYNNYELLKSKHIRIPNIVTFIRKMKENNISIDNVDSINELIKTLYREMR